MPDNLGLAGLIRDMATKDETARRECVGMDVQMEASPLG